MKIERRADIAEAGERVYSLEVEGLHSFAVGELQVWAHNAPDDKTFGFPKPFWNWYHRRVKCKGDADLTKEEAEDLFEEWKEMGRPGPDNKGGRGGGR